jgi:YD repeat-containing protein
MALSWQELTTACGWLWTHQQYDWMGRVVRRIATDGDPQLSANDSDVFISYEGCGCAGGLVTTVEGERMPVPGTQNFARRKQRAYEDILGRTWKTETFEWDGTTVYSSVVNVFNGRDQVTLSRHYQGSTSSTVFQDTMAAFDGHGRMTASHRPQQRDGSNNPAFTTYNHNADGSISSVTDARGAVTHYQYNSRGLVEEMSWSVPQNSGIVVPATVEFSYDALGNRTQMTDALGSVSYDYDELSRLTAETRQFNTQDTSLPNNTAVLEYTYTMGGQLASYKLPFFSNLEVSYTHDKLGRLNSAAGTSSLGNVTYASNAQYRAWGVLKHLEYGNGVEMNMTAFNNRLQATGFEVKKGSTGIIGKTYAFNADGSTKTETDHLNAKFDRAYEYDHQARMTKALSGAEARGQTDSPYNIPYRQAYQYNAFGQRTESLTNHWQSISNNTVYTPWQNNRRTNGGIAYDVEGNRIIEPFKTWGYDAAGRLDQSDYEYAGPNYPEDYTREREWIGYDGDGRDLKVETMIQDEENGPVVGGELTYRVRSSVLGGKVVHENGEAYVFGGGEKLATVRKIEYPSTALLTKWHHKDANMSSYRSTGANGGVLGSGLGGVDWEQIETDPDGKSVGLSAPIYFPEQSNDLYTTGWSFGSLVNGQYVTYSVDGIHVPAEYIFSTRLDNRHGSLGIDLLFFSVNVARRIKAWRFIGLDGYDRTFAVGQVSEHAVSMLNRGWANAYTVFDDSWSVALSLISRIPSREGVQGSDQLVIDRAVDAVRKILEGDNECSNFFKNQTAALNALKAFHSKARVVSFSGSEDPNVGIQMTSNQRVGLTQSFNADGSRYTYNPEKPDLKAAYRVFGQVSINQTGPFLNKFARSRPGRYSPGYLQSQVLQILHELAHMVLNEEGRPLIPDDGSKDPITGKVASSEQNTRKILESCEKEIKALPRNK